jgi:ATP-dependent RNA helicase RhlE
MSLDKLRSALQELLPLKGIISLSEFQEKIIECVKSGRNLLLEGEEGSGKSTGLLLAVLQLITEPGEGSPRALVICSSDDKAYEFHSKIEKLCKPLDLTVDLAHERGNKLQQRNSLFDGTEIIVGTSKRIHDLYIQNGFNISKLKLFAIDDVDEVIKAGYITQISRLAESLPKCRFLLTSSNFVDSRIDLFLKKNVVVYTRLER